MIKLILALSVLIQFGGAQLSFSTENFENSILAEGESCQLNNNSLGICTEIAQCEWTKKLLTEKRTSEIIRCAFHGKQPLVCCPQSPKFTQALCGNLKPSLTLVYKIANGMRADVGQFPFQAALGWRSVEDALQFNCGGSLIADDVVITAAHCVNQINNAPTMVRLGRTSLDLNDPDDDSTAVDIDIEAVKIHPEYSSRTKYNDIALLKLKRPVAFSSTLQPICLSIDDENLPPTFTITGFGALKYQPNSEESQSPWLMKGTIEKLTDSECKSMYQSVGKEVISGQVCVSNANGTSACQGDSGGPMSFKKDGHFYQYGIISYGPKCGSQFPALYTRVNQYLDWIGEEMMKFEIRV